MSNFIHIFFIFFLSVQEGQTPLHLATADDVRSLLQDAMMSQPSLTPATGGAAAPPVSPASPKPPGTPCKSASQSAVSPAPSLISINNIGAEGN